MNSGASGLDTMSRHRVSGNRDTGWRQELNAGGRRCEAGAVLSQESLVLAGRWRRAQEEELVCFDWEASVAAT